MMANESGPGWPAENGTKAGDSGASSPALLALRTAFIAAVALAIAGCNCLTLAVLWRSKGDFPPGSTRVTMASLALSDLCIGALVAVFVPASALDAWPYGRSLCTVLCCALLLLAGVSAMNLAGLTLDRFVAITRPFAYPTLLTPKRVLAVAVFVWAVTPIVFGVGTAVLKPEIVYNPDAVMCLLRMGPEALRLDVITLCLIFILPMGIMMGLYAKLIHTAHLQAQRINALNAPASVGDRARGGEAPAAGRHQQPRAGSGKAVRLFGTIAAAYTLSWLPFNAVRVRADLMGGDQPVPGWLLFACIWSAILNSLWNFFIYIIMNRTFRHLAKQVLVDIFRR